MLRAVLKVLGTGRIGTVCTPASSGDDAFMTTIVETPMFANNDPSRTVRPCNANFTSANSTSLVLESGGENRVDPDGNPFIVVAAASPGATDHPATGRTVGSPSQSTRYAPVLFGASELSDWATLFAGRLKRPLAELSRNGAVLMTSIETSSPAKICRHPKPACRRSFSSALTPSPINSAIIAMYSASSTSTSGVNTPIQ